MNLKEIEYIIKISEEKNITRAAEKLYITPSALNQQLLNLEKELETPLFFRSRTGFTPTEAGKIYLKAAKEILRLKKDAYNHLQDIIKSKKGSISIGVPPERGSDMFTCVYPIFHKEYPNITIKIIEVNVKQQQKLISNGVLDIGFMTLKSSQKTDDEYIPICSEELVLITPTSHPLCKKSKKGKGPYPEIDLALFQNEDFALMYRESTISEHVENIFRQVKIIPNVLFETTRASTILDVVSKNMCCGIIPNSIAIPHKKNVSFFCFPNHPCWEIMVSYKKGGYLNKATKRFIELASDYWNNSF